MATERLISTVERDRAQTENCAMSVTTGKIYDRLEHRWRRPTKYEKQRRRLPYGIWGELDGSTTLFNRDYQPLWRRRPDGTVTRADERPHWVEQNWFFNDSNPPWVNKKTLKLCEDILHEFGVGGEQ
jgi:hypothetical protein